MPIEELTLESLLVQAEESQFKVDEDVTMEELCFEMMDIERELMTIEKNMVVLEAAKAIDISKSKKKAVKAKKSKMKAKDAKELKKSGKKCTVSKCEDEEVDGGTGPLPTTTDTNGLTDTDLDAMPDDVEVQVSEATDESAGMSDLLGMEGVDYFLVMEGDVGSQEDDTEGNTSSSSAASTINDPKQNKLKENAKKFGEAVKKAFAKLIEMVGRFANTIMQWLSQVEKTFKANKGKMNFDVDTPVKGKIVNPKNIPYNAFSAGDEKGNPVFGSFRWVTEMISEDDTVDNNSSAGSKTVAHLDQIKGKVKEVSESIKNLTSGDDPENGTPLKDTGWNEGEIEKFINTFGKAEVKKLKEAQKPLNDAMKKEFKGTAQAKAAREAASVCNGIISLRVKVYNSCSGSIMKVMKAAMGSKSTEENK